MRLADRRTVTRFEILGELWGSVQTVEPLRVCNLAPEGALVESGSPLRVGSVHAIRLIRGAEATEIRATVRHLSPTHPEGGGVRYLVGLEFLNLGGQAAWRIGRVLGEEPERLNPGED